MGTVYGVWAEEGSGCVGATYMHNHTTIKEARERAHDFWHAWWREPDNTMRATLTRDIVTITGNHLDEAGVDWLLEFGCKHCGRVHFAAGSFGEVTTRSGAPRVELVLKCDEPPFADYGATIKSGKVWIVYWEEVRIGPRSRLSPLAC